jgi:sugar phosphate isomerase/epimerase
VAGWDRLDRELEELLAAASSDGTAVSCHVHTGTIVEDLADAKDLVRRLPLAGLCLDTAHSGLFDDLATFVRELGASVDHVHLRDLRRPPAEVLADYLPARRDLRVLLRMGPDLVPPGDGLLDLALGLEGLARNQEWWVVEMEPFDGLEARRFALARAHRVGHSLLDATMNEQR